MRPPLPSSDVHAVPYPADPGLAVLGIARWRDRAAEIDDPEVAAFMGAIADDPAGARLLASLFGSSAVAEGPEE